MEINNNDKTFLEEGMVLADFSASWCGPCKMFAPIFEEFSDKTDVKCVKIDVDNNQELAREYIVMSVPTIILFKDGKEINRHNGYMSLEQLEEFVQNK